jgi:flavin reductase (DIM6/NTAB) family NADH-FMN oxidoreductase RutF
MDTKAATSIQALNSRTFRDTMGVFATGVAVITTEVGGVPQGMTVNSLTSLSTNPPALLVCLTGGTRTADAVLARGAFVVNLLNQNQQEISGRFAKRGEDHFDGLTVDVTEDGLPAMIGTAARIECLVNAVHDGGDHHIVVGRVVACNAAPVPPLLFYRGSYHRLAEPDRD